MDVKSDVVFVLFSAPLLTLGAMVLKEGYSPCSIDLLYSLILLLWISLFRCLLLYAKQERFNYFKK